MKRVSLALSLIVAGTALHADEVKMAPTATCPSEPVLTEEWAGWKQVTSIKTMSKYRANMVDQWLPVRNIRTGMALHPIGNVEYWVTPGKPLLARTYGGLNNINVEKAGRLKIALNDGAWIDLVKDGVAVPSVAHGHGAECSGIRKIVEFVVTPGTYIVQIVNAQHSSMSAMAILADQSSIGVSGLRTRIRPLAIRLITGSSF